MAACDSRFEEVPNTQQVRNTIAQIKSTDNAVLSRVLWWEENTEQHGKQAEGRGISMSNNIYSQSLIKKTEWCSHVDM